MGSRLVKYEFTPKENEQIEAILKVPEETRSVIHGVVIDCKNRPIKDAVVKLLEVLPGNPCRMKPLTHTFTDNCGQFLFGPLHCNKKYALKIWYSNIKIRELIITPDCDGHCNDEHSEDDYYDNGHYDQHNDDHSDDEYRDDYCDGHYDGHCDIDFEEYFDGFSDKHSEDHCDDECDEHSDEHDHHSEGKYQEKRSDEKSRRRRDRHSDDDNYIHYKAPKVYGQKCTKCEITKNRVNNFEDVEK